MRRLAHDAVVASVAFSEDGGSILSVAGGTARLWRIDRETEPVTVGPPGQVRTAALSPDGGQVATADGSATVKIWSSGSAEASATA